MHAVFFPTFRCNLSCEYCYITKEKYGLKNIKEYSAEEWIEGLTWFSNKYERISRIDISGGEPFVKKDIVTLLEALSEQSFVCLTTNAVYIPEEFLALVEKRKKFFLTVSTHLKDGEIHPKTVENLRMLKGKVPMQINFVAYPGEVLAFEKAKALAKELDITAHLEPCVDYEKLAFSSLSEEEKKYADEHFSNAEKRAMCKKNTRKYCLIGLSYSVISPDGFVYPCLSFMLLRKNYYTNIFDKNPLNLPETPLICDLFCACSHNYLGG